jgi:rare lipoprotein A
VKASFYADGFNGRNMANGQKFDQCGITAASLKYPLGTLVRVRSILTGNEILVTITDRGPWNHKYSLDLSKAAFKALGLDLRAGWGWVTVEVEHGDKVTGVSEAGQHDT